MQIPSIALVLSSALLVGCAAGSTAPGVEEKATASTPSPTTHEPTATTVGGALTKPLSSDVAVQETPDEAVRPEDIAGVFISALVSGDTELASEFIARSIDDDDSGAWMSSIRIDDGAWVIDPYPLQTAADRALVLVSVATPNAEPIGYLLSLIEDDGWKIVAIQFA